MHTAETTVEFYWHEIRLLIHKLQTRILHLYIYMGISFFVAAF